MKRLHVLLAAAFIGLAACDAPPGTPNPAADAAAVRDHDLVISFNNVALPDKVGAEFMDAAASQGGRLVVVQYTVKNAGRLPVPAHEIPAIRIYDRAGVAYAPDAALSAAVATEPGMVADNKLFSDLNPGITTQGADVFEISREAWAAGGWRVGWEGAAEADLVPIGGTAPPA